MKNVQLFDANTYTALILRFVFVQNFENTGCFAYADGPSWKWNFHKGLSGIGANDRYFGG